MSGLVTVFAPESARNHLINEVASGSARDAAAARVISGAANGGDEAAAEFAAEAQVLLGSAAVHRARAARLRACAAQAAIVGADRLSAIGGDAALVQEHEADKVEAAVIGAVRQSHSPGPYGYVSPEEARMLERKNVLDHMTSGQLEQAFSSVLGKLYASSGNYEDEDAEEIDDESARKLYMAADTFGGDLPFVFGAGVYGAFWDFFKPNQRRMRKRLKKRLRRLRKMEDRLEDLEDEGKKGAQVHWLRLNVRRAEKSISRLRRKLGDLDDAGEEMKVSQRAAEKYEREFNSDLDDLLEEEGILGSANGAAAGPEGRKVFVGFFDRRAASYGNEPVSPDAYGAGFFKQIGSWFSNLWGGAKTTAKRHKVATQAAREARAPHQATVDEARKSAAGWIKAWQKRKKSQRASGREARRTSLRSDRGAPVSTSKVAVQQSRSRVVTVPSQDGGWTYQQDADGSIKILKAPVAFVSSEGAVISRSHQHWQGITDEINAVAGPTVGSAAYLG